MDVASVLRLGAALSADAHFVEKMKGSKSDVRQGDKAGFADAALNNKRVHRESWCALLA